MLSVHLDSILTYFKNRSVFFLLLLVSGLWVFPKQVIAQTARPKLVVGIIVDQMRWDYLYRFNRLYGQNGFKRLIKEGFNCQETFINYLPTYTACGHAAAYTGSVPALNGIVGNDWFDRQSGKHVYCVEDSTVSPVGGSEKSGRMSPRNLLTNTVTDELRLATNFASRVIGLSIKDRGAILPAGHSANAAYWYDTQTGNFMTSSYYQKNLPDWLTKFNQRNLPDSLMKLNWTTLLPLQNYTESTADNNDYEGNLKNEQQPVFPHQTSQLSLNDKWSTLPFTPFANTILRMLAEDCIQSERLGQEGNTDFLTVSFSATDYIGHVFGPNSIEAEDVYLRLDQEIARLLNFLDAKLGKGNYLVFLTADHGGSHNAMFLKDHQIPAGTISISKLTQSLNRHLYTSFRDSSLVRSLYNYQVFLNEKRVKALSLNRVQLLDSITAWLNHQDGVLDVYNMENGEENRAPGDLAQTIRNSYFKDRTGVLQIILNPQWYSSFHTTGATHGSWNPYDSHIPLLWYGWGIHPGETFNKVEMTDIAPTLSALLKIQMPNGSIGRVILPILKGKGF